MQGHREGGVEEGMEVCPKCGLPITRLYKNKKGNNIYYIAYHKIGRRQYRLCYLGPEEYKYGVRTHGVLENSKNVGSMELRMVNINDLRFLVTADEIGKNLHDLVIQSFAESMRASIELYGVYPNPIHVSSDGYVIDGNARVEAARKLGLKELPAIIHGIECSKEGDKCLSLRVLLHLESDRMGYNEVGEMASIINKYAQEYLETLDEGSRKKLLDQLRRYESTRRLEVEEPLRSFLNYMMKRTGFPSSTIMRLLDIP